jgi:hypothetical protein
MIIFLNYENHIYILATIINQQLKINFFFINLDNIMIS